MTDYRYNNHQARAYDSDLYGGADYDSYSQSRGINGDYFGGPSRGGGRDDPYRRYNDEREDPYRRGGGGPVGLSDVDRRRPQYTSDSYNTTPTNEYPDPLYSSPMNRNSMYGPLSPSPAAAVVIVYDLDHLATFTVSSKQSLVSPQDGMRQLRQMETTTGVWTMRVELRISRKELVVVETKTRKEIECFPISRVQEPVHMRSDNPLDLYNNVVIFTVAGDGTSRTPSEMNVFQCIGVPAEEVAEDINAARTGKFPRQKTPPVVKDKQPLPRSNIEQYETDRRPLYEEPPHRPPVPVNGAPETRATPKSAPLPGPVSAAAPQAAAVAVENTELGVTQLNQCFDDIERFVASLQQAANAQKELEKQQANGAKQSELDFLRKRSVAPSTAEFVDILQKFKFAFNLLPRLKTVLKEPNAEELTHVIFSPLTVVLDASRDEQGRHKLANNVISPLLTRDTCKLLEKCLTRKELDLWQGLGQSWTCPSESWKEPAPTPYTPIFKDREKPNGTEVGSRPGSEESRPSAMTNGNGISPADSAAVAAGGANVNQQKYLNELRAKKCKICQVQASRAGQNTKELNLVAGEYLEVVNDEKNWWKVSNIAKDIGYAPKTILKPLYGF